MRSRLLIGIAAFVAANAFCSGSRAQDEDDARDKGRPLRSQIETGAQAKPSRRTATIHWQRVPLRDALGRLHALFNDKVFVDRRVDPNMRVSLDIEAASAEQVVAAIADGRYLGVARLGSLVYLGPASAAGQLKSLSAARAEQVARLPVISRTPLTQKQSTSWPRLSEPRRVVSSIVEHRDWLLSNAEAIPHDLWSAGELPELTLAEQLTVLLIGFDLTFELRPNDRSIEVVPRKDVIKLPVTNATGKRSAPQANSTHAKNDGRRVYTLRVQEQPVGAVLKELTKRLHWTIEIDDESVRKAGRSLDKRISFSVENANRERLLEALLSPAGLDYRLEDDRVRIFARSDEK